MTKLCEDEGCPHYGIKHICVEKTKIKIPEDLRDEYEEMRNRKKHGFWLTSIEEKVYALTKRIAKLEAENSFLKEILESCEITDVDFEKKTFRVKANPEYWKGVYGTRGEEEKT